MNFSLTYLAGRLVYRIFDFFHHWYADASKVFLNKLISFLGTLDQKIALRITLRYFFQPLFKDYSFIGRILGVVFRTCRVIAGILVYFFVLAIFIAAYVSWLAAPVILILYVFGAK